MRFTIVIIILFTLFCSDSLSQYNKYGSRFVRSYSFSREDFEHRQFVMATQDHRGIMYFANIIKLAEYDGYEWRIIEGIDLPQSVATDPYDGRVYAASNSDFGYVSTDASGKSVFFSLLNTLPENSDIGLGFKIEFTEESVFFIGVACVIEYNKTTKTSVQWNINTVAPDLFEGKIYGTLRSNCICQEERDTFYQTPIKTDRPGDILLEMFRWNKDEILLTLGTSLQLYNEKTHTQKDVTIGDYSKNVGEAGQLDKVIPINDNLYAISTRGAITLGAYAFVDSSLNVVDYIGAQTGLNENFASSSFLSQNDGLLWTTDFGVSNINTRSPLRVLNKASDIQGSFTALVYNGGTLYGATTDGLHQRILDSNGFYKFRKLPHEYTSGAIYGLTKFNNPYTGEKSVLAFADGGIFTSSHGRVIRLDSKYKNHGLQSPLDPTIIYSNSENVIMATKVMPDNTLKGIKEYKLPNSAILSDYQFIGEDLWCITYDYDVYRINIKTSEVNAYKHEEDDKAYMIKGKPVIFTADGKIVRLSDNLQFTDTIATPLNNNNGELLEGYGDGYLVFNYSRGLGFLAPTEADNSEFEYLDIPDVELLNLTTPSRAVDEADSTIYFTEDKTVYTYRVDPEFNILRTDIKKKHYTFNALIRSVNIKDSLLFAGNHIDKDSLFTLSQQKNAIPTIAHSMADLTFGFAATCYEQENKTQFSFFLDGVSESWSEWSTNHTTNFTNLFEGKYTFRVKARNVYGTESSIGEYSFIILPPFYRTIWAYILYVIILSLIVYEAMIIYGKKLKRENELLEEMVEERTQMIRKRDEEILSNINYASYIQHAALTPKDQISIIFPEHFIMYRPHSIVSGDFYLVTSFGTKKICIVADCTGHGVSGGFLSMLGMAFFKQIVSTTQTPSDILFEMRKHIIENLHQGSESVNSQDGMDASVYVIDSTTNRLEFAGANSRLVIIHNGELVELKGDKMPVSTHFAHNEDKYTDSVFDLTPGDMVYTFSDGYIDQFGGDDNKKFKMSRFRDLLISIANLPIHKQSAIINETFDKFKGDHPQTDDVVVMGVRV